MATTYQTPGVYIEEVPSGPQPIAGASTNVLAVVGPTVKGPAAPTRITSWTDFVTKFGPPIAGTFTAPAVYGFFENGGPAAYVVRADSSTAASWMVTDRTAADAFLISAASAGTWANSLGVTVAPDTGGASGSLLHVRRTAGSAVTNPGGGSLYRIPVTSTVGLELNQDVQVVRTGGAALDATVSAVTPDSVTVDSAANLTLEDVIGVGRGAAAAATSIVLASGAGFKVGDLIEVTQPDRSRVAARVTAIAPAGNGFDLTLDAALAADVPAAEFVTRTVTYHGSIDVARRHVSFANLSFTELPAPVVGQLVSDAHRATAHNGAQATWEELTAGEFDFLSSVPAGAVDVEASLRAELFTEAVAVAGNITEADLDAQFGFMPDGAVLELFNGAASLGTVTKTAGSFALGGIASPVTEARFVPPADPAPAGDPRDPSAGVVVRCSHPIVIGDHLDYAAGPLVVTGVNSPSGNVYIVTHAAGSHDVGAGPFDVQDIVASEVNPLRFSVAVTEAGVEVERYSGLSLDGNHPAFYAKDGVINDVSERIVAGPRLVAGVPTVATTPAAVALSAAGTTGPATNATFKAAINQLDTETEPAMLIAPDALGLGDDLLTADVIGAMTTHCENFRRYAIIDLPDEDDDQDLLSWRLSNVTSMYAGTFAPHLKIVNLDPAANERYVHVPPSGFVAGVIARTDNERGVWKAPGNERVKGIVGLRVDYTDRRQDLLNPGGVNLIRSFATRGRRVWGARNATDDTTWRYINVRRLFNFLENSIERGTQWVVFEPNDAKTWLRVRVSVENFLNGVWRAGGLLGNAPDEAYRVRVGLGETMTETDIDLGLIVIEVAVRPVKPAEFVVFRFSHKRPEQ